jgi:enolase
MSDPYLYKNTNILVNKLGIKNKVANAVLIKPNQIGSVSETMQTIRLAQRNNYNCVMSHKFCLFRLPK